MPERDVVQSLRVWVLNPLRGGWGMLHRARGPNNNIEMGMVRTGAASTARQASWLYDFFESTADPGRQRSLQAGVFMASKQPGLGTVWLRPALTSTGFSPHKPTKAGGSTEPPQGVPDLKAVVWQLSRTLRAIPLPSFLVGCLFCLSWLSFLVFLC